MPWSSFFSLFFRERNVQNRMLYPVRSDAPANYVKEALTSGIAKKQKSPCMSRKNPVLIHGLVFNWEGWVFYAQKVSGIHNLIQMIHSDSFVHPWFFTYREILY